MGAQLSADCGSQNHARNCQPTVILESRAQLSADCGSQNHARNCQHTVVPRNVCATIGTLWLPESHAKLSAYCGSQKCARNCQQTVAPIIMRATVSTLWLPESHAQLSTDCSGDCGDKNRWTRNNASCNQQPTHAAKKYLVRNEALVWNTELMMQRGVEVAGSGVGL
jgi:hypothetical protein